MFRFRTALVAVFLALSLLRSGARGDDGTRPRHRYG